MQTEHSSIDRFTQIRMISAIPGFRSAHGNFKTPQASMKEADSSNPRQVHRCKRLVAVNQTLVSQTENARTLGCWDAIVDGSCHLSTPVFLTSPAQHPQRAPCTRCISWSRPTSAIRPRILWSLLWVAVPPRCLCLE